jgi:hypothetical protein
MEREILLLRGPPCLGLGYYGLGALAVLGTLRTPRTKNLLLQLAACSRLAADYLQKFDLAIYLK